MSDPAQLLREIVARESGVPWMELAEIQKEITDDAEMNRRMRAEWASMPVGTQKELCNYYAASKTWLMQTYNQGHGALEALARGEKSGPSAWSSEFMRYLPSGASILDFGGGFLKDSWFFVPEGYRVVLMEVEGPVVRIVQAFMGAIGRTEVSVVPVRDEDPPLGQYDGAVCFEVLEHVKNPVVLASKIAASIRPGGPLAISVSFGAPDHAPYHLAENASLSNLDVWNAELRKIGLEPIWADASSIRLWRKNR